MDNKSSLLASLTGDLGSSGAADSATPAAEQDLFGDLPEPGEQDLFGSIPLHDSTAKNEDPLQQTMNSAAPAVVATNGPPSNSSHGDAANAPVAPAPQKPSLLASSGLLDDTTTSSTNGGLFDAVDEEQARLEEEERKRQEAAARAQEEAQRAEEARRLQAAQEAEEQARLAQQMQAQTLQAEPRPFSPGGFYRNHAPPPPQQQSLPSYNGNLQYSTAGGAVQTHTLRPSTTVGMHNTSSQGAVQPPTRTITAPPMSTPLYGVITVSDPMLHQSSGFLLNAPHWTYQISCQVLEGGSWLVRRRFRHVVALEERLRQECPGSILPPRPDKHATRAIEEASTSQTAEFAMQRAQELQIYLNQLAQHPVAGHSSVLRLFLALQDDMGTAWPEVSNNAITRLGATGAAAMQLANTSTKVAEDSAELLALTSSEELRMGAVTQAVPKLEGAVTLLKEHGERSGAVGMELGRFTKETTDTEHQSFGILSTGLLRNGRREKRLAVELGAAMTAFWHQYKLCRYEKLAFHDRRQALMRVHKERTKADQRAQKLLLQPGQASMEREAVVSDELAVQAQRQAEHVGQVLKQEVNRVAYERRTEWSQSMKVVASAMKEASTERVAIWESTREAFMQAFPEYNPSSTSTVASGMTA